MKEATAGDDRLSATRSLIGPIGQLPVSRLLIGPFIADFFK